MTYYADLSSYRYGVSESITNLNVLLNVGWLDKENEFPKGKVKPEIIAKLKDIILQKPRVRSTRGYHYCDFCGACGMSKYPQNVEAATIHQGDKYLTLGDAEVWLPSVAGAMPGKIFTAPNMVYHYIVAHSYLPPEPFLKAIEGFDINADWYGDRIFFALLARFALSPEEREDIFSRDALFPLIERGYFPGIKTTGDLMNVPELEGLDIEIKKEG